MTVTILDVATTVSYAVSTTSTTDFTVPFPFDEADDLVVKVDGEVVAFTLLSGTLDSGIYTSGVVRLNAAVTSSAVTITRDGELEQRATWTDSDPFRPSTLSRELSRLWMAQQDTAELAGRALRVPEGEASPDELPEASARTDKLVGFDSAGALKMFPAATLAPGATEPSGLPVVCIDSFTDVIGDNIVDDAAAIEAALAFVGSGIVWFGKKTYRLGRAVVLSKLNSLTILGCGMFASGTKLRLSGVVPQAFDVRGCSHTFIDNFYMAGQANSAAVTSGWVLQFRQATDGTACFDVGFDNIRMDYAFNGVKVTGTGDCNIGKLRLRYMMGTRGVQIGGDATYGVYGTTIERLDADNPMPRAHPGLSRVFLTPAASRAQSLGDILYVPSTGRIYQCTTAGTSALVGGPTGAIITGTSTDGTAVWTLCGGNMEWLSQDTNAYSVRLKGAALLNGAAGMTMRHTGGGADIPQWFFFDFLETDHPLSGGMVLQYGRGVYGDKAWIGSTMAGNGVVEETTFGGEVVVQTVRIVGNAFHGWVHPAGPKHVILKAGIIAHNSVLASGTCSGFIADVNATDFMVGDIIGGDVLGFATTQAYTVAISAGCDRYTLGNIQGFNEVGGAVLGTNIGATKNLGQWLPSGQMDRKLGTIPAGSTSAVISHRLGVAPANCLMTPRNDTGVGIRFWPDSFTATTVTINLSAAVGFDQVFDLLFLPQPAP